MSSQTTSQRFSEAHKSDNLKGPGDARPTAQQIIESERLVNTLSGVVVLITGCSSGIGVETARALHSTGADVFITARDMPKGEKVVAELKASKTAGAGKVELVRMELDRLVSVREGAADFLQRSGGRLNILINNAGVMACPKSKTHDNFETQFGVNHLAHHLLFRLLTPALLASATPERPSRLVSLASSAHRMAQPDLADLNFVKREYNEWTAYGQAKTCNIWLAVEAERRYGAKNLHALAVHPGFILTELARHMPDSAKASWSDPNFVRVIKNQPQGAATSVWAAVSSELVGRGGLYLEDVSESVLRPIDSKLGFVDVMRSNRAEYADDPEAARVLWNTSDKLTGFTEL